jgi:hypothetical protein
MIAYPRLFVSLHLHAAPQHVDPRPPWWIRSRAILAVLGARLCRILHPYFGELPFHALR